MDDHVYFYEEKKKRIFKLVNLQTGAKIGRYVGKTPMQAARKAFRRFITDLKTTTPADQVDDVEFEFGLYERALKTTIKYSGKWLRYRQPLHIPMRTHKAGILCEKVVVYNYTSCVKRLGKI